MWNQVHEMLFIEKGGEAQIADELRAYNPLVPKGRELVATVMFEIDDPARRAALLAKLGGVEATAVLLAGGSTIAGVPEADGARPTELERYPRGRRRPPVRGAGDRDEHHHHDQRGDGKRSPNAPLVGV